jgi:hypothetical protein
MCKWHLTTRVLKYLMQHLANYMDNRKVKIQIKDFNTHLLVINETIHIRDIEYLKKIENEFVS